MRIRDWSSDVCSSDLRGIRVASATVDGRQAWPDHGRRQRPFAGLGHCPGRACPGGGTGLHLPGLGAGAPRASAARKSVVEGTRVSVRVALGGPRIVQTKINTEYRGVMRIVIIM